MNKTTKSGMKNEVGRGREWGKRYYQRIGKNRIAWYLLRLTYFIYVFFFYIESHSENRSYYTVVGKIGITYGMLQNQKKRGELI